MDEVEPDAADRERHRGDEGRRTGYDGQAGQSQREQECSADRGDRRRCVFDESTEDHPER